MDDDIRLPEDTLRILNEFLKEQQEREAKENEQGSDIEKFEENWVRNLVRTFSGTGIKDPSYSK